MQEIGFYLASLLFGIMMFGVVVILPLWLIITIIVPKKLMQSYFKEPHFTFNETIFMARYPGSLFRTVVFGWTIVLQPFGHKGFRKLEGIRQAMPTWYAYSLYFLVYSACISLIVVAILFVILFGLAYYQGKL